MGSGGGPEQGERSHRGRGSSALARIAAAVAVVAAVLIVGFLLVSGGSGAYSVTARFENAGQLVTGNEVLVNGVPAGTVTDIQVTRDGQADVSFEVKERYVPLRAGTRAVVKQSSLSGIANRYIDVQLGAQSDAEIPDGGRIGPDQTETAVELDQLFNLFDPVARVAVQDFFQGQERALRGRSREIRRGTRYLNPALSSSRRLFEELTRDEVLLSRFLGDSADLVGALEDRRGDLTGVVRNLNTTFGALAGEKQAVADSIEALPPFLRQANTTFVDLRSTLDEVDPLVDASKPVARRLRPFLQEARGLAADARPTVRDLSLTTRRSGGANDLIDFVNSFPPLAEVAVGRVRDNGAVRRGAFPETAEALRQAAPQAGFARPYTNDLLGWFDDFSTTGAYDALGGFSRAGIYFTEIMNGGQPVRQDQFRKCPGAAEAPARDGSNVFSPAEQERLDCDDSDRAVGNVP